jgi:hypothetical protein
MPTERLRVPRIRGSATLALLLLASACSDVTGTGSERALGLWIGETGVVLDLGDEVELGARVQVTNDSPRAREAGTSIIAPWDARWWSDDESVVRIVDEVSGAIRAVSPGRTTVWIQAAGRRDSATVSVRAEGAEPSTRWSEVSTYASGSCALDSGGRAYCWGDDFWGGLGSGGVRRQWTVAHSPVPVTTSHAFEEIGKGLGFACARTAAGDVWCWGLHHGSQLGHGRPGVDFETTPVRVELPEPATQLGVGALHACVLSEGGRVHCWGNNMVFQLGAADDVLSSADRGGRTLPVAFEGQFAGLAVGDYATCGITPSREAWCWGETEGGAPHLGQRTRVPARIAFGDPVLAVYPGGGGCILDFGGVVSCWGLMRLAPTGTYQVPVASTIEARIARLAGPCGLKADGSAWCWGSSVFDLIDPGATTEPCSEMLDARCSSQPVAVPGQHSFRNLSVSQAACGITTAGELYCWGSNDRGQLGTGRPDLASTHVPQRVQDPL